MFFPHASSSVQYSLRRKSLPPEGDDATVDSKGRFLGWLEKQEATNTSWKKTTEADDGEGAEGDEAGPEGAGKGRKSQRR